MIISSDNKMKKNSLFNAKTQTMSQNKSLTISKVSTQNSKTNTNNNTKELLKKIETPLEFIKQKKQFKIHDLFDVNGTKVFLDSKETAMKEINLDDEILEQKIKENKNDNNTISPSIDSKNETYIKEKTHKKVKFKKDFNSEKNNNDNKEYINPEVKKNKIQQFKNLNKVKNSNINEKTENNNDNNNISDNNILIIEKKTNDSQDSNYLYRFIINNANDSIDEFHKKLEKIRKKETYKKKHIKKKPICKSLTNKKRKSYIPEKKEIIEITRYNSVRNLEKEANLFNFSEKAKTLMINDNDIELSSINSINNNSPEIHIVKNNIILIGKKENIFLGEEEKEFIKAQKDSIISIINELL